MPQSWVQDEDKWDMAKRQAQKQGRGGDYEYITGIYKKAGGRINGKSIAKAHETVAFSSLEKATRGAGSRGGKVVGYTKGGKPIYESSKGKVDGAVKGFINAFDKVEDAKKKVAARGRTDADSKALEAALNERENALRSAVRIAENLDRSNPLHKEYLDKVDKYKKSLPRLSKAIDGESKMSETHETIAFHELESRIELEKAKARKEGEEWTQPSGRRVKKVGGKIVPAPSTREGKEKLSNWKSEDMGTGHKKHTSPDSPNIIIMEIPTPPHMLGGGMKKTYFEVFKQTLGKWENQGGTAYTLAAAKEKAGEIHNSLPERMKRISSSAASLPDIDPVTGEQATMSHSYGRVLPNDPGIRKKKYYEHAAEFWAREASDSTPPPRHMPKERVPSYKKTAKERAKRYKEIIENSSLSKAHDTVAFKRLESMLA